MKKTAIYYLALFCFVLCFGGCAERADHIALFSREDGSGTREMFANGLGLIENGSDKISDLAYVTGSGAVMLTAISKNENAIGFLSAVAVNDTVKVLKIDGLLPKDGNSYPLFRDFRVVYFDEHNSIVHDFAAYLCSQKASSIIRESGYFTFVNEINYSVDKTLNGELTIAGSASVFPLMNALALDYEKYHPGVHIEIQQNDSATGIRLFERGMIDMAMSSREIKEGEITKEYRDLAFAGDAIAVIVHPDNPIENIDKKRLALIYAGKIKKWADVM